MKDAREPVDLTAPVIDPVVSTAAVLGLKIDSSGKPLPFHDDLYFLD